MITLTSDFGTPYPAAMKGVLCQRTDARLVDIAHDFPRQDVRAAAFWLRETLPYFPPATHLVVVDPGVGTDRNALVLRAGEHTLVGPDNGVLRPVARRLVGDGPLERTSSTSLGSSESNPLSSRLRPMQWPRVETTRDRRVTRFTAGTCSPPPLRPSTTRHSRRSRSVPFSSRVPSGRVSTVSYPRRHSRRTGRGDRRGTGRRRLRERHYERPGRVPWRLPARRRERRDSFRR